MDIYQIEKIEKVENGYIVEYYRGGSKSSVFRSLEEVLRFVKGYFINREKD